jgi:hypothetical protein
MSGRIVPTKAEWAQIEERLSLLYNGGVDLDVDGFHLQLSLERSDAMRNVIMVYVGGVWKGVWIVNDCEERRRFMCPTTRYVNSKARRAEWEKERKKFRRDLEFRDKMDKHYNATFTGYSPCWKSFRALKAHLLKNNDAIELLKGVPRG